MVSKYGYRVSLRDRPRLKDDGIRAPWRLRRYRNGHLPNGSGRNYKSYSKASQVSQSEITTSSH